MKLHLKRIFSVSLVVLVMSIATLMIPAMHTSTAHAATMHTSTTHAARVSCMYDTCDGKSPISTGCSSDEVVEYAKSWSSSPVGGGTIELVFSPTCHAAWAHVSFNSAMPSGYAGDATINRNKSLGNESCFDAGGNGLVEPGQHSCYSPMLGDGPKESTFAVASYNDYAANTTNLLTSTPSF
jgi:hypothetical protein